MRPAAQEFGQGLNQDSPALRADAAWLRLIDAGKYAEAWNQAAPLIRNAVPQADFTRSVGAVRTPLGTAGERKLLQAVEKTSVPGVPDGHYVIAQFSTAFEKKAGQSVETITAAQQPDGSWLVAGYLIR